MFVFAGMKADHYSLGLLGLYSTDTDIDTLKISAAYSY